MVGSGGDALKLDAFRVNNFSAAVKIEMRRRTPFRHMHQSASGDSCPHTETLPVDPP